MLAGEDFGFSLMGILAAIVVDVVLVVAPLFCFLLEIPPLPPQTSPLLRTAAELLLPLRQFPILMSLNQKLTWWGRVD